MAKIRTSICCVSWFWGKYGYGFVCIRMNYCKKQLNKTYPFSYPNHQCSKLTFILHTVIFWDKLLCNNFLLAWSRRYVKTLILNGAKVETQSIIVSDAGCWGRVPGYCLYKSELPDGEKGRPDPRNWGPLGPWIAWNILKVYVKTYIK